MKLRTKGVKKMTWQPTRITVWTIFGPIEVSAWIAPEIPGLAVSCEPQMGFWVPTHVASGRRFGGDFNDAGRAKLAIELYCTGLDFTQSREDICREKEAEGIIWQAMNYVYGWAD